MPRTVYVANVGVGGVLERSTCEEQARRTGTGWFDGDEVTLVERGTGTCDAWSRITASDGRGSWILNEYLADEQP